LHLIVYGYIHKVTVNFTELAKSVTICH
jgi:hypothetical protein